MRMALFEIIEMHSNILQLKFVIGLSKVCLRMALFEMHCNILQLTFDILFNIRNLLNSIIISKKSFDRQVCLMIRHQRDLIYLGD